MGQICPSFQTSRLISIYHSFYQPSLPNKGPKRLTANVRWSSSSLLESIYLESWAIPAKQSRQELNLVIQQLIRDFSFLDPDRGCSTELFPAWFVSSVMVHRTLRSCRNMQAQTQGPASSPTLWKGTIRHGAGPYAPIGHLDRARGEWPPGNIHVDHCHLLTCKLMS